MNKVLDCPVLGLTDEFPSTLYVLKHPPSGKYGCYCHQGIYGLASFSDEQSALGFAEFIERRGMVTEEVDFDRAREIAKERPMPIISLMLLDDLREPVIHYVR